MMIRIELSKQEAQILLQMIAQFNWAGPNLESTKQNVAVATALQEKFRKVLEGDTDKK